MLEKITDGETYEVSLTNMLEAEMEVDTKPDTQPDTLGMYRALRADNPTPFGAYLKVQGSHRPQHLARTVRAHHGRWSRRIKADQGHAGTWCHRE